MQRSRFVTFGMGMVLTVSLAGCMDGTGGTSPGGENATRAATQTAERDVEAPEVFSKRDAGLWDGRPSLGGVWVAHPDVRDPERVIIRNTENGQQTVGALFRRERMNPGPVFQVSADAAAAVSMLAGAPTTLEIVALRTEDVRVAAPAPAAAPTAEDDVAQQAAATPAPSAPTPRAAPQPGDVTLIAMPPDEEDAAPQPRRGLFSRIFSRNADPAPAAAGVETTALDDPAAPPGGPSPAQQAQATQAQPPTPRAPQPASTLDRPFIQLGIFSVEANAGRAQSMARASGLPARVTSGSAQGNAYWRVTVGPAATAEERRQILEQVKSLGFNDAYTVRR
ncbi:SPOR domain-containing protein [Roseinatronobacter sp. NSM]|uniref:SPOR domain-containing protein n=1 Tax=Roseinatronobacter sp. NSM TaxID=3457785 RepID=UPI00403622F9